MLTMALLPGHRYLPIIIASKTLKSGISVKRFFFFPKNFLVTCRSEIRIIKQICSAYRFLLFFRFLLPLACWTTFDKEGASLVFINQSLRVTTGLQGMQPPCHEPAATVGFVPGKNYLLPMEKKQVQENARKREAVYPSIMFKETIFSL
jgi:hypothetical protein